MTSETEEKFKSTERKYKQNSRKILTKDTEHLRALPKTSENCDIYLNGCENCSKNPRILLTQRTTTMGKLYIYSVLFMSMFASSVSGTYGPYHYKILSPPSEKCPTGTWAKSQCRLEFGDCKPGYACIPPRSLFPTPGLPNGICCPKYRRCPLWGIPGPLCGSSFKPFCPFGLKCTHTIPVCPAGSTSDGLCHKMFPCRPGFHCLNGVCCSKLETKSVCPPPYFAFDGLKCGLDVHCPGEALCLDFQCCHPKKKQQSIVIKPFIIPVKPHPMMRPKSVKPRLPMPRKIKKPPYVPPKVRYPTTIKEFPRPQRTLPTRPPLAKPGIPDPQTVPPSAPPTAPPSALPTIPWLPLVGLPLPSTCPRGLQRLEGLECDHILSCPGNSLCISGVCCSASYIKKCPVNHEQIPEINCRLRQRCPAGSQCVSGVCCIPPLPPSCPDGLSHALHLSCDLGTCTGSSKCISGICCSPVIASTGRGTHVPSQPTSQTIIYPPATPPRLSRFDQQPFIPPVAPPTVNHTPITQSLPKTLPHTKPSTHPPLLNPKAIPAAPPSLPTQTQFAPVIPKISLPTNPSLILMIRSSRTPTQNTHKPTQSVRTVSKISIIPSKTPPVFNYPKAVQTPIPMRPVKDSTPYVIRITKPPTTSPSIVSSKSKLPPINQQTRLRTFAPTGILKTSQNATSSPIIHIYQPTFPPSLDVHTFPTPNKVPKPSPIPQTAPPPVFIKPLIKKSSSTKGPVIIPPVVPITIPPAVSLPPMTPPPYPNIIPPIAPVTIPPTFPPMTPSPNSDTIPPFVSVTISPAVTLPPMAPPPNPDTIPPVAPVTIPPAVTLPPITPPPNPNIIPPVAPITFPPAVTLPPITPPPNPNIIPPVAPITIPPAVTLPPMTPPPNFPTVPPIIFYPTFPPTVPQTFKPFISPTQPPTVPARLPPVIPATFPPMPADIPYVSFPNPFVPPMASATIPPLSSTPNSTFAPSVTSSWWPHNSNMYTTNATNSTQPVKQTPTPSTVVSTTASPVPAHVTFLNIPKIYVTYPPPLPIKSLNNTPTQPTLPTLPTLPPIDMTFPPDPPTFANIIIKTTTVPTRFITSLQITKKKSKFSPPTTSIPPLVTETTPTSTNQPIALTCPPGNISIPGLSCGSVYKCPVGSNCYSGICCLSVERVQVPACPVDFLSSNPCPAKPKADLCTVDQDCGPYMICCLTSCDQRVCRPMVAPQHIIPR